MKPTILICGAEGQLGKCLRDIASQHDYIWHYTDIDTLDITNREAVFQTFSDIKPTLLVNCSAYTAVDNAETDKDAAYTVNAYAVKNLAEACVFFQCRFIHVSTDYVFDGEANCPYTEIDRENPRSVYGASKLAGEQYAVETDKQTVIIRTSWLYSEYGKNFLKTMIRLGNEKSEVQVIYDQTGTPTYAGDLAVAILTVADRYFHDEQWVPGIYHFSNEGVCSWYDFAVNIMKKQHLHCKVIPIVSAAFPSKVKRPAYSVLSKDKIKTTYHIPVPYWTDSLEVCLKRLGSIH